MIIGICGPSGAGKDTAGAMLEHELGYTHVSGGDILREMLSSLGLEPKKTALGPFGEFIRANYGLEPLFERVMQKGRGGNNIVVTGFRAPDEARLIQAQGGLVIYVDANADIRYERIVARSRAADAISREDFMKVDRQEQSGSKGTDQNLTVIKELTDVIAVVNEGTVEELAEKIRAAVKA